MGLVAGASFAAPTAHWRIADTSAALFGQEVATDLVPAAGVARGSVGLVRSGEPPRWPICEHVPNAVRSGARGLGDEPRRCSGHLPTARTQGYDGLATRRIHGCSNDPGRTQKQTPVSNPGLAVQHRRLSVTSVASLENWSPSAL